MPKWGLFILSMFFMPRTLLCKEALQDGRYLRTGGTAFWCEFVVTHTIDEAFPSPKGLASRRGTSSEKRFS